MRLIERFAVLALGSVFVNACAEDLLNPKHTLSLEVRGLHKPPSDFADGNSNPRSIQMTIDSLEWLRAEGEPVSIEIDGDSIATKITSRIEKVFEVDISSLVGEEFTGLRLGVQNPIVVAGRFEEEEITLIDNQSVAEGTITIKRGKNLQAVVEMWWLHTVHQDPDARSESFIAPLVNLKVIEL